MHDQPGLGIEHVAMIAALVVRGRVVLDGKELGYRDQAIVDDHLNGGFRRASDDGGLAAQIDGREELGESFVEPRRPLESIRVQQQVSIFMEDGVPLIVALGGKIESDVVLGLAFLVQAGEFHRLAFVDRRNLPQSFRILESQYLYRTGGLDLTVKHQGAENLSHLLKAKRHIASALLAGVGDYGEVRRLYLVPLFGRKSLSRKQQKD